MKVESLSDPSGQIGFFIAEYSKIITEMDAEIIEAIAKIEEKYKTQLEDLEQIINSARSLLT
jgi:hypothetical protein